jgi:hypothetical protein
MWTQSALSVQTHTTAALQYKEARENNTQETSPAEGKKLQHYLIAL